MPHILKTWVAVFFWITFSRQAISNPGRMAAVCYNDARSLSGVVIDGQVSLADKLSKAILIVNTASFCSFTRQYLGLNDLEDEFGDDLEILGFPCNQFGLQEPGIDREIINTLRCVRPGGGYQPNFYLHSKIEVNGPHAHQLFVELKKACPPVKTLIGSPASLFWSPIQVGDVTWNFNKFLLDKRGVPFKRYDSAVEPRQLRDDIAMVIRDEHKLVARPHRPAYL